MSFVLKCVKKKTEEKQKRCEIELQGKVFLFLSFRQANAFNFGKGEEKRKGAQLTILLVCASRCHPIVA